jgi:rhamnulose-1-phosphate aldolase
MTLEMLAKRVARNARDIWIRGWAEAGAGNVSVRVTPSLLDGEEVLRSQREWVPLDPGVPELADTFLLLTASGSLFRTLEETLEKGCGVIELDDKGERYRVVWGFKDGAVPSSEMRAHLGVHAIRSRARAGQPLAVIHVHATHLVALTQALSLDTISLTRLLWSTHAECMAFFPEGVEVAPWQVPGSQALSEVTARAVENRRLVVWPFHGVVALGKDLDEALGLIEVGEKAAELYMESAGLGGLGKGLGTDALKAIATVFGVEPDEAILNAPVVLPRAVSRRNRRGKEEEA